MSLLAQHSALCCVCSMYIAKGRSEIDALPVILPPDPAKTFIRARTGEYFVGGRPVRGHAPEVLGSKWAHARCAVKAWKAWPTNEAFQQERQRRLVALAEKAELAEQRW